MGTKKSSDAASNAGDDLRWHASSAKGVLYRDHPDRKYGRRPDRYLAIRYRSGSGKRTLEALGWASEGWTLEMAANLLHELKQNIRSGERPQSLKEKREMQEVARTEEARAAERVKLKSVTFGELAEAYRSWAKDHRLDASNVEGLLDHHILPVLGTRVAHEITTAELQTLGNTIAAKRPLSGRNKNNKDGRLSPQTVLHALKVVRETFNYAKQTEAPGAPGTMLFDRPNPAIITHRGHRGVRVQKVDARRLRVLNDKEIESLLAYEGRRHDEGTELHDMILLSLDIGLRAGELVHLLRESCDPVTGTISVIKGSDDNISTKGGRSRTLHVGQLFPEALVMLRGRMAGPGAAPYLFPGQDGSARDSNGLNRAMRRMTEKLKLNEGVINAQNRVVWHTLRHTFATRMLEAGADIYMLKELMGHGSVTTTEVYLHLCDLDKRRKALARLTLSQGGEQSVISAGQQLS